MTFHVLFVCTRDLCRAPIAAAHFARAAEGPGRRRPDTPRRPLPAGTRRAPGGITISSAGTEVDPGEPLDPVAVRVLTQLGHRTDGYAPTPLTPELVERAHLVLTADLRQRKTLLKASPGALRRTFTLREFAELGEGLAPPGSADLATRVAQVAAQRGSGPPVDNDSRNIPLAEGAGARARQRAAKDVAAAVTQIAAILGLG